MMPVVRVMDALYTVRSKLLEDDLYEDVLAVDILVEAANRAGHEHLDLAGTKKSVVTTLDYLDDTSDAISKATSAAVRDVLDSLT